MVVLREKILKEPKELGEVFDAVEAILTVAIAKGSTSEKLAKATAEFSKMLVAIEGIEKVGAEVKDKAMYQASGAFVGRVVELLVAKADEPVDVALTVEA